MDRPRERLERLRGEIDLIDDQIVKLLNDRAKIVLKVKEVKSEERWAVHDQEREDALFKRIAAISAGPLDGQTLRHIYERILECLKAFELEED